MSQIKINPNSLIGKAYDKETYHCYHFIENVLDVPKLKDIHVDTANGDVAKYIDLFTEIDEPCNYCIVLLGKSHIGIYYNGGIYHADVPAVRYETQRVLKMKYPTFKYYEVKENSI